MYFPELAPRVEGDDRVLRVGWLEGSEPYEQGRTPEGLVEKLLKLAVERPVLQTRGFHSCTLCRPTTEVQLTVEYQGRRVHLGSAEVWIPYGLGRWFSCPDLVLHYVTHHQYLPPAEFVAAVESLNPDDGSYAPAAFVERVREDAWKRKQESGRA